MTCDAEERRTGGAMLVSNPLISRPAVPSSAPPVRLTAPPRPLSRDARAAALLAAAKRATPRERRRLEQQVVLDYLEVARAVANRFRSATQDYGDLCQVAYIGLTKAVQRFEPSRGHDIVSFAVPTISGEIKRYLRDTSWTVRPPRRVQELWSELQAETPELTQQLGREPTVDELAEATGRSRSRVAEALRSVQGRIPLSLDAPADGGTDDGMIALRDLLASADDPGFERVDLACSISAACRELSETERRILRLRFYEERTQTEIAAELGVSQMQVSRLLRKILCKMRSALAVASATD